MTPFALALQVPQPWYERPEIAVPVLLAALTLLFFVATNFRRIRSALRTRKDHILDPLQLQVMMAGEPPLVVDLRRHDDFHGKHGHIRGAVNVPLPELPRRLDELRKLQGNRNLVLMDAGMDTQAHEAYQFLLAKGFPWLYVLRGGMRAWRSEAFRTYQ